MNRIAVDAVRCGVLQQPHAPPREDGAHALPRRHRLARQDFALGRERHRDLGAARHLAQAMVDGERQFDAAGTAADHGDSQRALPVLDPFEEAQPALPEFCNGLHRRRMLGRARDRVHARRGADIERHEIVGDRRAILEPHLPVDPVEPDRFGTDQPCAGPGTQPRQVDMAFVEGIAAGHEARDHAGIGCLDVPTDQGEPHPGHRLHAEASQHMDMRMAAAHEHEVLEEGRSLHPPSYRIWVGRRKTPATDRGTWGAPSHRRWRRRRCGRSSICRAIHTTSPGRRP